VTEASRPLDREYLAALARYVEAGDEPALSLAYELGRRAMFEGRGVLDMAALHATALKELARSATHADREHLADRAAAFLHELLSPFEMSLRGYQSANDELRRLNERLARQKEDVETANRELESFSYSVSHDLRAPLRAIDGFSKLLLSDHASSLNETGKAHLRRVREAAQRMGQLIEDLIGLARVTRSEVHRTDVDLTLLARRICEGLQAAAPERTLVFRIEEGIRTQGDARLLSVLLENLLGNAFKFTSKRAVAEIAFGREERGGISAYYVRDNGAGFDMAYAGKLFGAFQRLHAAADFEGTGIGLATVQRVVHRHHGRIWAEAQVDAGATFYFTLGAERSP
jgi:light-regulated signal transduction histidine kinase (bacteriophytochrome)